ncbi:MAG: hypothetical protein SGARI_001689 [Bacillariaceae sp.]
MTVVSKDSKDKENDDSGGTGTAAAVRVYVRVRPLIDEEQDHAEMQYKISNGSSLKIQMPAKKQPQVNPAFAVNAPPPFLRRRQQNDCKVFDGFSSIVPPGATNEDVYHQTIQPVLQDLQQSLCVFTYGHTGSGKSHTLLGYDGKPDSLGIYKYAVQDLFAQFEQDDNRILLVRCIELYNQKVRDLMTGDECTIREDKQRVVQVRAPFVEDDEGKVHQRPLGQVCRSSQEVVAIIDQACEARRVGTSTHHDKSSRSHLFLELEVVTHDLMEQRTTCQMQEAQLTRLKWLQTEKTAFGKHVGKPLPQWTEPYTKSASKLRNEIKEYEQLVKESSAALAKTEHGLGNTLVFCDLAGNEYARDAAASTKEEMEEAAEINKSLLAVKEMMRSLNTSCSDVSSKSKKTAKHVSYRDSKLSMILKRHLEPNQVQRTGKKNAAAETNNNQCRAIMMGHVSPSQEYIRKTLNTLTYCSMVGKAATAAAVSKTANKPE